MTDYISRDAAIQAIEDIDENAGARGSGFTDPERIMRDNAFYALESIQPADVVPTPRWIPVKERLPEPGERVLVAVDCRFVAEAFVNKSGVWMRNGFEMDWCPPTHWMPLPEPPNEEK